MLYNKFNFTIRDFCASSSSRPELTGVFITPNKTISTDSFILAEVENVKTDIAGFPEMPNKPKPMTNFQSFILPKDKASDVIKLFKGSNSTIPIVNNAVVLKRDKEMVEIAKTDLESVDSIMSRVIDGQYPNTNDILVERGKYVSINVNAGFLKKIAGFLSDFTSRNRLKEITIKVPFNNVWEKDKFMSPIRFFAKNDDTGQKARILLMPIKE